MTRAERVREARLGLEEVLYHTEEFHPAYARMEALITEAYRLEAMFTEV